MDEKDGGDKDEDDESSLEAARPDALCGVNPVLGSAEAGGALRKAAGMSSFLPPPPPLSATSSRSSKPISVL